MMRWGGVALLLAIAAVALALRLPKLDTRPLHNDEGVNAVTSAELWQNGKYAYNPDEYHGPSLHYATVPFFWLSGANTSADLPDKTLRLAPVLFGVALIFLLLLLRGGLSEGAMVWAAIFITVSPAMVFYSRYFIHEMLLVFFTLLAIGAGWRYAQAAVCSRRCEAAGKGHPRLHRRGYTAMWAGLTGAGIGLMFATKETFVISIAAMVIAGEITAWWQTRMGNFQWRRDICWKHVALALASMLLVWLLFFTSFFTNFAGLADSIVTYLPWLKRAGGHSPHIHPWYFYLQRLAWFHPLKGGYWSEGFILVLAAIGFVLALRGQNLLHRFLALYTLVLTGAYSVISYKTPWCLLNFYIGMILLAAIGATAIVNSFHSRGMKVLSVFALSAFVIHLGWQAWCASLGKALRHNPKTRAYELVSDWRNPYVYAQTLPDVLKLVDRADGIGRVAPNGFDAVVKVIAPESDYWPLPWYLRRFKNVGWYDRIPDDPFAPIVIASAKTDPRLDEKSDRKWVMVGYNEFRPDVFLVTYVELELWKKYVATLPRDRDD